MGWRHSVGAGFEVADSLNVAAWKRKFCRSAKASSDGIGAFPTKELDNENDDERIKEALKLHSGSERGTGDSASQTSEARGTKPRVSTACNTGFRALR